jgi:hypothetical protein
MSKERLGALGFLLAGIIGLIQSAVLPWGSLARPGPGLFPLLLSVLLCILGALLLFSERRQEPLQWAAMVRRRARIWQIILLTGAFIVTLERLGYPLVSLFYLFALFSWTCRFRVGQAAGLAALLTVASWYAFVGLLGVQLPPGVFRLP